MIVTADFLKLTDVYELLWATTFDPQFVEVVDNCKLNLNSLCEPVLSDIAKRISLQKLLVLKERLDKFISNVFRKKSETVLTSQDLFKCDFCG